jgi:hypothetical protein
MDICCVYYASPDGRCRLGQCTCNRVLHLTCSYERPNRKKKEPKKEKKTK